MSRRLAAVAAAIAGAAVAAGLLLPPGAGPRQEPAGRATAGGAKGTTYAASGTFLETFDGSPGAPRPWRPGDWDVTVHTIHDYRALSPMRAHHGSDCGPPPAHHSRGGKDDADSYGTAVFLCRDHLMTAMAEDGFVLLTPPAMIDFSAGEATIRWDMSTLRTVSRDWTALYIMPFERNFQLPGQFGQDPPEAITVTMGHTVDNPSLEVTARRGGTSSRVGNPDTAPRLRDVLPPFSAVRRDTFELRLSRTHVTLRAPAYGLTLVDQDIAPLSWDRAVLSFGQQAYTPDKDCPQGGDQSGERCGPGTWHWDNLSISPATPFTILPADRRYVSGDSQTDEVTLAAPSPEGAFLRFVAGGGARAPEFSTDGGRTWRRAESPQHDGSADHYQAYWTPIPAGARAVRFRPGQSGNWSWWAVKDIHVWAATPPKAGRPAVDAAPAPALEEGAAGAAGEPAADAPSPDAP